MTTAMTGNVDIAVRTQVDYFGAGRYDLAGQMVTPDYVDHEAPPGTPPGPDGANAVLRWLRGAFADLSYEIRDAFGDGRPRRGPPDHQGDAHRGVHGHAAHRTALRDRGDPHLPHRRRQGRRALGQAR